MQFERTSAIFPVKNNHIFLNSCGVSPLPAKATEAEIELIRLVGQHGSAARKSFAAPSSKFRTTASRLLKTKKENVAFIPSCAYGLSIVANGLNLKEGDEIISYRYEYPSNHYPWKLQERRGAKLKLIQGEEWRGKPLKFSIEELEKLITRRTKVVALSHVQFTSGFAVDLKAVGELCKKNEILFIVDGAQSVGGLPVYPDQVGIDCLVTSGWKWLLGPIGSGILYTSPRIRDLLTPILVGPDMMQQGIDFLNHSWNPYPDSRIFEYSTLPPSLMLSLAVAIEECALKYSLERIEDEIRSHHKLFLDAAPKGVILAPLSEAERGGILSFDLGVDGDGVAKKMEESGVICTVRGGYFRVAPHFYLEPEEIKSAADKLAQVLNHG